MEAAQMKMTYYKYCVVPKCKNTNRSTPNKIFFRVPKDPKTRKKWCKVMKKEPLSSKTNHFCCEDHFDLENDMENYIKYRLVGGILKLKNGVLPHKFDCQRKKEAAAERNAFRKRRMIELMERVLNPKILHENLITQEEFVACETIDSDLNDTEIDPIADDNETTVDNYPKNKSVAVQVKIKPKSRSKATNTNAVESDEPPKFKKMKIQKNHRKPLYDSFISYFVSADLSECSDSTDDSEMNPKVETELFKKHMLQGTLMAISREPKLFLGLPSQLYFCIKYLSENVEKPLVDVLLSLKKIRQRESNSVLGVHFGVSESIVIRNFQETVPKVAHCLQKLIFLPPRGDIRLNLPIPFRKRFSTVISIIDCLEIKIEKPSSPVHQTLTWSQYKNSNTIKYLISITPDGLISFISEGYGGRTSDDVIFEDCGFLQMLSPGDVVMADRGFKNIAHLLKRRGCKLLRPPSVDLAALRVHVQRSVERVMEFEMIAPHACVDIYNITILDHVVTSACGVVNLQDCSNHVQNKNNVY